MHRFRLLAPLAALLVAGLTACGGTPAAAPTAPPAPTVAAPALAPASPAATDAAATEPAATPPAPAASPVAGKPGAQVVSDPASSFSMPGAAAATPTIEGLQTYVVTSAEHTNDPVAYPQSPPVGGPHFPVWQTCGAYSVPLPNERAVHSEEHGAVWLTYQPDLPQKQVTRLQKLADGSDDILVSPYPGQDAPIIASAWGAQLKLDSPGDKRLDQFIAFYAGHGPEQASCRGGTTETTPFGTPIGATPMAQPSA